MRSRTRAIAGDLGMVGLGAALALLLAPGLGSGQRSKRDQAEARERPGHGGHGADAASPQEIPAAGWWHIAKRTFSEVGSDRVLAVAAGVTFYGLLAVFPALTAFISLYGLVADPQTVIEHLSLLQGVMPAAAYELLRDQALRLVQNGEQELGLALAVSLALSIWSANAGMKAIFDALNVAYGEDEKRSFVRLNLVSLGFTAGALLFALVAILALVAIPVILDYLYLGEVLQPLLVIGRWPLVILVVMLGLAALYRFGPSRDEAKWRWVSPGALVAATAWLIGSAAFSWYVANFGDYDATYGAVGAVIGLLTWMWLSAIVILVGAELNSETERQTLRDTTKGAPRPIGLRGADAADRKG
ncbi:MAG: YihY/virulence factor BrkB family protein [Bosea sp. (in: a-proteobacteria)]